jgi:osmotically-inducible protein OsmY
MKKIIISAILLANTLLLGGCSPVIQSASTLSTAITTTNDRRTAGEVLDDRTIMFNLFTWPLTDTALKDAHLNFMVYNKTVLITGEVPTNKLRNYVTKQAQLQDYKIKQVFNEITVSPNNSLLNRAKDSTITLQVEALFYDQEVFHPAHIRVMTENKTVYLMGAVTKREADKAVKSAIKAKGVKKVVKFFNYLKNRPIAEVERDRQFKINAQKKAELQKQQAILDAKKDKLKQEIKALNGNTKGTFF